MNLLEAVFPLMCSGARAMSVRWRPLSSPPSPSSPVTEVTVVNKHTRYMQQSEQFFSPHHSVQFHPHVRRIFASSFLQAHRETEAHFTATGVPSQRNHSDSFRFKRAAFYKSLRSKVGLAVAKAPAFRINLDVEGFGLESVGGSR